MRDTIQLRMIGSKLTQTNNIICIFSKKLFKVNRFRSIDTVLVVYHPFQISCNIQQCGRFSPGTRLKTSHMNLEIKYLVLKKGQYGTYMKEKHKVDLYQAYFIFFIQS